MTDYGKYPVPDDSCAKTSRASITGPCDRHALSAPPGLSQAAELPPVAGLEQLVPFPFHAAHWGESTRGSGRPALYSVHHVRQAGKTTRGAVSRVAGNYLIHRSPQHHIFHRTKRNPGLHDTSSGSLNSGEKYPIGSFQHKRGHELRQQPAAAGRGKGLHAQSGNQGRVLGAKRPG